MLPGPCQPGGQPGSSRAPAPVPAPPQQRGSGSSNPLVSVPLPSTREVMTREMMDCKYPANGCLQPGWGPGTPTGNVSTGLGHAGPGPAGGSSASRLGELSRSSSHPCSPSLWGDEFSVIPIEQPHCRGSRERGVEGDSEMGGNHRGFLWGHSSPHGPSPAVPRMVVSMMVLVDIFMASPSSPIFVSTKKF